MKMFRFANTCANCGEPVTAVYAPNVDVARAGGGVCQVCAEGSMEPEWGDHGPPGLADVDATDGARQLAEEAGVDLAEVAAGLEPGARITKVDVQAWLGS